MKKHIANDIEKVFLNPNEFADDVLINGKSIKVVVDNDQRSYEGVREEMDRGVGNILFFANKETWRSTYGSIPREGDALMFNSLPCTVMRATDRNGVLSISLDYGG